MDCDLVVRFSILHSLVKTVNSYINYIRIKLQMFRLRVEIAVIMSRPTHIVLDLDETLVHSVLGPCSLRIADHHHIPWKRMWFCVSLRPHCRQFISWARQHFRIVVFSAADSYYVKSVADLLSIPADLLLHSEHLELSTCGLTKSLRIVCSITQLPVHHFIAVDDNPLHFLGDEDRDRVIRLTPWSDDPSDSELLNVMRRISACHLGAQAIPGGLPERTPPEGICISSASESVMDTTDRDGASGDKTRINDWNGIISSKHPVLAVHPIPGFIQEDECDDHPPFLSKDFESHGREHQDIDAAETPTLRHLLDSCAQIAEFSSQESCLHSTTYDSIIFVNGASFELRMFAFYCKGRSDITFEKFVEESGLDDDRLKLVNDIPALDLLHYSINKPDTYVLISLRRMSDR